MSGTPQPEYTPGSESVEAVAGEPLRTRWQELVRGSFMHKLIRKASNLDIHVIARR